MKGRRKERKEGRVRDVEWIRETKKETRKIGGDVKENQRWKNGEMGNVKTGSIVKERGWENCKEEKRGNMQYWL